MSVEQHPTRWWDWCISEGEKKKKKKKEKKRKKKEIFD